MLIAFRANLFDTSSDLPEGAFHGEDLAKWLEARLKGWQTRVHAEDWGWAVLAQRDQYEYIFGVYDSDTNDVTENGPKWILRLYNQKDRSNWLKKLFKYIPPTTDKEVTHEIVQLLEHADGVTNIEVESL